MSGGQWSEKEVLELQGEREEVVKKLVHALANDTGNIFAAELGFGSPQMDLAAVTKLRTIEGYVLRFPVVNGGISSMPYYQGFGETAFLCDQMVNEPYLVVPDYDIEEVVPFVFESSVVKRVKKRTHDIGLAVFDRDYSIRKVKTPLPRPRKYVRLELELADSILKYGKIEVETGKEEVYREYTEWVKGEFEDIGKRLMDRKNAELLSKKILRDNRYYEVKMSLKEAEVESTPQTVPIFMVEGEGNHLGEDKKFRFSINRISGRITWA